MIPSRLIVVVSFASCGIDLSSHSLLVSACFAGPEDSSLTLRLKNPFTSLSLPRNLKLDSLFFFSMGLKDPVRWTLDPQSSGPNTSVGESGASKSIKSFLCTSLSNDCKKYSTKRLEKVVEAPETSYTGLSPKNWTNSLANCLAATSALSLQNSSQRPLGNFVPISPLKQAIKAKKC